jgi:hypothetical protein
VAEAVSDGGITHGESEYSVACTVQDVSFVSLVDLKGAAVYRSGHADAEIAPARDPQVPHARSHGVLL